MSWNQFTPANVRAAWKNGPNLKPGCTGPTYSGGNPTAPTDLKASMLDGSNNLKKGLTNAADNGLKERIQA